jgi:PAS domain S-box-containing protein
MSGPALEWSSWETPGMAGALFQHATEALLLVDPLSERVLDANDQACALSGLTREELLGTPLRTLLRHEQGWQDWPPLHEKIFSAKEGFLLRTREAERRVEVGVRMSRLPLPGAGLTALVALSDRRDQVELSRRLQRAEADLRCILASASDCLWSCRIDPQGRWTYRYLSPGVQRLTGRGAGVFLADAQAWEGAVHPDDRPAWRRFRERLGAGGSGALEYRLHNPSGPPVWVHENVLVSPEEGGLVLNGVLTDISERKRGGAVLSAAQERLDSVAGLAGAIAHDLNNLLTGILGHISLAKLTPPLPEGLDQIEAVTLRAAELCKQLGVVAGKTRSRDQTRDVAAAVRQGLQTLEHTLPSSRFRVDLPRDLPPAAIDEPHLRQVVEALARNAAEATGPSGGEVVVRAGAGAPAEAEGAPNFSFRAAEPAAQGVWVEVRDSGPGIPPEVLARLGEPFVTARPGHRGLGLALALGILRGHRGGLEVYTGPGRGTLVRVLLPPASEPAPAAEPAKPEGAGEHRHGTVLLADDEETVRDVAARLLRSAGCEVITASDGEEALKQLEQHAGEVQVALLDLTMPRLSGEPLLRELRRLAPGLSVVLMSGYPEAEILPHFSEWGLVGYLQKPFRLPALLELLRRVLPAQPSCDR